MKIGYVGLGKMGFNMVLRLLEQGIEVVAWNRSVEPGEELKKENSKATVVADLATLVSNLDTPRTIWLMVPSDAVDQVILQLKDHLQSGDLLIDGGNSYWKDSITRAAELEKSGVRFLDVGTSGGPGGARDGACLMIGGKREQFLKLKPLFKAIAAPDAFGFFGQVGAGHFVKMVHNAIEYGMMEAIGEGAAALKSSDFDLDLVEVFRVYNNRSVIESRLVGWIYQALSEDPELKEITSTISSATKEGPWTLQVAEKEGIQMPVLEASLQVRKNSPQDQEDSANGFRNKVVSAMRGKFGQHDVKKRKTA